MKKIFLGLILTSSLIACKKETNATTTNGGGTGTSTDTNQKSAINFTSLGTPVGSFQNNIIDVDGNTYKTVKIGNQIWMAENLKTSKYSDATEIPNITDKTQWSNLKTGAWAFYNNDTSNNAKYGKLYNWYAVSKTTNGNKNVCPIGWHIPTDAEWTVLTSYLGGDSISGGKMKEVGFTSWNTPNSESTNSSLFTGMPGGDRDFNGNFSGIGRSGEFWSSTLEGDILANYQHLNYNHGISKHYSFVKSFGMSVRCLKD